VVFFRGYVGEICQLKLEISVLLCVIQCKQRNVKKNRVYTLQSKLAIFVYRDFELQPADGTHLTNFVS
jgi:hypothetical protein